jgi:hypothetical protein
MLTQRLIATALAAFGAGYFAWFIWALIAAWRSRHWPTTNGKVVSSKVEIDHDDGELYRAAVSYRYVVDSIEYCSERIFFGDFSWTWGFRSARRRVAKYYAGSTVRVYYDPETPEEAVLEPGFTFTMFVAGFFGILFLVGGINAFVVA